MSYYSRFKILSHNPLWRVYLRWAYKRCVDDLGKNASFRKNNFTALLCGTSGEITSEEFARFVLSRNPTAKVIILDIGREQVEQSRTRLREVFPHANVRYLNEDAIATSLEADSVDYIETDGFLEYFTKEKLAALLSEWKRIGRKNSFVTMRAFARKTVVGRIADFIRVFLGKRYFQVSLNVHTEKELMAAFRTAGFSSIRTELTFCPTYRRFSMIT